MAKDGVPLREMFVLFAAGSKNVAAQDLIRSEFRNFAERLGHKTWISKY